MKQDSPALHLPHGWFVLLRQNEAVDSGHNASPNESDNWVWFLNLVYCNGREDYHWLTFSINTEIQLKGICIFYDDAGFKIRLYIFNVAYS